MTKKFIIKNLPRPNGKFKLTEKDIAELHVDIQDVDLRNGHAIVVLSPEADEDTFVSQLNGSESWKRTLTVTPWIPRAQFESEKRFEKSKAAIEDDREGDRGRNGDRGRSQSRGPRGRSQSRGPLGPRGPRVVEVRGSNYLVLIIPSVSEFLGVYEYVIAEGKVMTPKSNQALVGCGTYDPALLVSPSPTPSNKKKFKKIIPDSVTVIHKRTLGVATETGEVISREGVSDEVSQVIETIKAANIPNKNIIILRFEGEGVLTSIMALVGALSEKLNITLNLTKIYQLSQGAQEIPIFKLQKWPEDDE